MFMQDQSCYLAQDFSCCCISATVMLKIWLLSCSGLYDNMARIGAAIMLRIRAAVMVRSRHANMFRMKAFVIIRMKDALMLSIKTAVMLTIYAFLLIMGTSYRRTS
jgi:hypothetical protein